MKRKQSRRVLSFILCMALTVAVALCTAGCNGKTGAGTDAQVGNEAGTIPAGTEERAADTPDEEDAGTKAGEEVQAGTETNIEGTGSDSTEPEGEALAEGEALSGGVIGTGSTMFTFTIVDPSGTETEFEVHTDKETVGDALLELGLIEGEESEYGLFVKTVNGITADYDRDGVYWAFYVGGDYASESVSATPVTEGGHYAFQVE